MPLRGSVRKAVLERDERRCQYCGTPAVHVDHIIPKALRRRHHIADDDVRYLTSACAVCNWRKLTRRLAPVAWAERLHELPGTGWRIWRGDVETLHEVCK